MTEPPPRRWLVVGAGGSGKSTLALRMGERLGLPVVHLDRHYWRSGWVEPHPEDWAHQVEALTAADAWVMDGNYSGTLALRLQRAQAVVLLDLPPVLCALRVLWRRLRSSRYPRPDLPEGCRDQVDLDFLRWILSYRSRSLPKVMARLRETPPDHQYHLRSLGGVRRFVSSLPGRDPD